MEYLEEKLKGFGKFHGLYFIGLCNSFGTLEKDNYFCPEDNYNYALFATSPDGTGIGNWIKIEEALKEMENVSLTCSAL